MKILHISDLHFGMNHRHMIQPFLDDVNSINPDGIIISGDLTQRAKSEQFEELRNNFLDKLNTNLVVVPGNHDVPLYNFISRILIPYKNYNKHIRLNYPSCLQNSQCNILGIDSTFPIQVKNGRIRDRSFQEMSSFFGDKNKINILTFHHNIDRVEGAHRPLLNHQEFLSYLKQSNINIVCTGHLHKTHCVQIEKEDGTKCLVLHVGSLLCTRSKDGFNGYFVINLPDQHHCDVELRIFKNNRFVLENTSSFEI